MKKTYSNPELEVVMVETTEVILSSGGGEGSGFIPEVGTEGDF